MGVFNGAEVKAHKVIKAYMNRMKQGKSQLKYLSTKGKSRAGSRVRLANARHFFAQINERMQQYLEQYPVQRIALSCPKSLLPHLYNAEVPCPFNKHDTRLYKVPRHVHTPKLDVLLDTHKFLLKGELIAANNRAQWAEQLVVSLL